MHSLKLKAIIISCRGTSERSNIFSISFHYGSNIKGIWHIVMSISNIVYVKDFGNKIFSWNFNKEMT